MSEALKAYRVDDEGGDGNSCVVFAKSNAPARRLGADELLTEWEGVSCRRAPEFDQYAPGPVPIGALLDAGWWFECAVCCQRVTGEDAPTLADGGVYCSPWHRLRDVERRARLVAERRLGVVMAILALPFPLPADAEGVVFSGSGRRAAPGCRFRFPGGKGAAEWSSAAPDRVTIAAQDAEAWEAFRGRGKGEASSVGGAP